MTPVRQCSPAKRQKPGHARVLAEVAGREGQPPVGLPAQREERVRADLERAVDAAGEVHAEERVARVGDRVDHAADELLLGRDDRHVLAAERHDPRRRRAADQPREPVGLQPAADDQPVDASGAPRPQTTSIRPLARAMPVTAVDSRIRPPACSISSPSLLARSRRSR